MPCLTRTGLRQEPRGRSVEHKRDLKMNEDSRGSSRGQKSPLSSAVFVTTDYTPRKLQVFPERLLPWCARERTVSEQEEAVREGSYRQLLQRQTHRKEKGNQRKFVASHLERDQPEFKPGQRLWAELPAHRAAWAAPCRGSPNLLFGGAGHAAVTPRLHTKRLTFKRVGDFPHGEANGCLPELCDT